MNGFIYIFSYRTLACGYFPQLTTESSLIIDGVLNEIPNCEYSFEKNEANGFLAPVKYHPTVLLQKYTMMDTPFNSACFKCGICLTVSEKLENILNFALKSSISLHDFDDYLSSQLLRPICDFGFKRSMTKMKFYFCKKKKLHFIILFFFSVTS